MAQIREYSSPIQGLRSGDQGAEAFAGAGRRIGAFYRETGQELSTSLKEAGDVADRSLTHMQVSHFDLGSSATLAKLDQSWNQLVSSGVDPNDPTVADKFMSETVEPALQKLGDGVTNEGAQRYAQNHIEELRNHFTTKTSADMSTLAGVAVQNNLLKVGNTLAGVSFDDPSSTKMALKKYSDSVDAQIATSNMNAEGVARLRAHAEEVKQNIAQSGVYGAINKNPNGDYSNLSNDPDIAPYLKAVDAKQFQTYQQGQQRITRSQQIQEQQEADRQKTEAANKIATDAYTKFTKVDPTTGKIIVTDPVGYAKATRDLAAVGKPGQLDTMVKFGEHLNESDGKETTDPLVKRGLQDGILDNAVSAEDIARAHVQGKLSGQDYHDTLGMYNELKRDPSSGPDVKTVLDAAKATITATVPGMPGKDPVGEKNYSDFVGRLVPAIARLSPEDRVKALNFKDPNSLVNQLMQPFVRTQQQKMKDLIVSYGAAGGDTVPGPAPEVVKMKGLTVPPALDGLRKAGNLESNGSVFRDKTTGKTYDRNGDAQ